jgi:hypothetical protein
MTHELTLANLEAAFRRLAARPPGEPAAAGGVGKAADGRRAMKFRRPDGTEVPAARAAAERRNWLDDRRRRVVPRDMGFACYVGKYLGWELEGNREGGR